MGAGADPEGAAARQQLLDWLAGIDEQLAGGCDHQAADVALVYLAHGDVVLDEDELHGAIRRAVLVRARGGSPLRDVDPDEHAVIRLADDLDDPGRRRDLLSALAEVAELVSGLPQLERRTAALQADPDRAWRLLAAALLADSLDDGD